MKKEIIYLFLAGGTGSILRYTIQQIMQERIMTCPFPWSTFTVNTIGSMLIGIFYALSAQLNLSTETRLLLTTGFCGGFTTFSTFSYENLLLLKQGAYGTFIAYLTASLILGITAAFLGAYFTENIFFLRKS